MNLDRNFGMPENCKVSWNIHSGGDSKRLFLRHKKLVKTAIILLKNILPMLAK